ncbi:MAG: nucleoside-triphosphatase [Candidatus Methanofastidiosia archaeon]
MITGEKGIGKTTLLKEVIEESPKDFYGVISERFDTGYYVQDVKTGEKMALCSEKGSGYKFKRFYFDFDAMKLCEDSLKQKGEILVYDEIGYLEMEEKINIWKYIQEPAIVIVRKDLVDKISSQYYTEIFEVKKGNRKELKNIILEKIENIN